MAEQISWALDVQVVGGARISESATIEVEAYDIVHVLLASDAANLEVEVQPGTLTQTLFLFIRADKYEDGVAGHSLSYKVGAADGTVVTLNAPHALIGSGAVGLLGTAPTKLFFSNTMSVDATVEILVGRDATP